MYKYWKYKNYKANYIFSTINTDNSYGYNRATIEAKYGIYLDYGNFSKTFFNNKLWNGNIDHGNHVPNEPFLLTDICFIHFHNRNIEQIKKKTINNVIGLGYNHNNNDELKKNIDKPGNHHIKNMIKINEGKFNFNTHYNPNNESIKLDIFNNFIRKLKENWFIKI